MELLLDQLPDLLQGQVPELLLELSVESRLNPKSDPRVSIFLGDSIYVFDSNRS